MAQRKASLGKVTRPNVSAVLPRKRLFALLDSHGAAAWVTGPPSCGKTTLAAYPRSMGWAPVKRGE